VSEFDGQSICCAESAIKLLTPTQTPEPITMSVKAAAHHRANFLLTIA
jgi:hypothetical protein